MPELDSLRGVAILAVVFYHGLYWSAVDVPLRGLASWLRLLSRAGWTGVNLFFVLSGFLITGILLDTRDRPDFYRRFYARRALRILPACYATLAILWVAGISTPAFVGLGCVFLSNVSPLLGVPMSYGPLWSLSVEEHFYLLWPTLVRRLGMRLISAAAALIIVLEPLAR